MTDGCKEYWWFARFSRLWFRVRTLGGYFASGKGGIVLQQPPQYAAMPKDFKVGDHVRWNSEAGHVSGIIKKIAANTKFKGYHTTLHGKRPNTSSRVTKRSM